MTMTEEQERDILQEKAKKLFLKTSHFVRGAVSLEGLPSPDRPELAFAGRSNVGKSSLLNALLGRKDLARTSNTPGRTRELNIFDIGGEIYLVDLPGYGYARAPRKTVQAWTSLTRLYWRGRPNLKRVFLLIDSRHGLKDSDDKVMDLLDDAAVVYQIVLTKTDKIRDLQACHDRVKASLMRRPAAHPEILTTSARKKTGLEDLRLHISSFLG